ncbi:hypothetical protein [Noviherbaspirillum sp.]|uniref:hypothetical protein n=1 Tax=Noviherbaspirillum sp. TaxID=1926288 RepID=UPI002B46DCA0|nr:hypothetical protein [Noviherbaspirillum sp.]HJV81396.1 hypothetical protein [Noviherbaspirillum sp.]
MNQVFLFKAAGCLACLSAATLFAAELPQPQPLPETNGPTTVYRQITSDGRIVYSDKTLQGAKVDHTITVEPPIKGNLWSTEAGSKPVAPQQSERTPVNKVPSIPVPGKTKTIEQANSDVIKAEMLLEDARKRQQAGDARLPGEPDAAYAARRKSLARDVADSEAMLNKALADRKALRSVRYGQLP